MFTEQGLPKNQVLELLSQTLDLDSTYTSGHPMYTEFIILFLSWFLLTAYILFFFLWLIFFVYIFLRIPQEEVMLFEKFSETYREYIIRTGRLFPPLRKQNKEDKTPKARVLRFSGQTPF